MCGGRVGVGVRVNLNGEVGRRVGVLGWVELGVALGVEGGFE